MIVYIGNEYLLDNKTLVHVQDVDYLEGTAKVIDANPYLTNLHLSFKISWPMWVSFDRLSKKPYITYGFKTKGI